MLRRPRIWLAGIGTMIALAGAVLGTASVQSALGGRPMASWWTTFLLGVVVGAFPCLLWVTVTSVDGSATWRIGADAEGWTAAALRGLGPAWRVEHAVPFSERRHVIDVDHVAIGPHGVLVVETKWTGHDLDLSAKHLPSEVARAIRQAADNAGRVRGLLSRVHASVDIIPVVVYWGPNVTPPSTQVRREAGIRLVAGEGGADWRPLLSRDRLDPETIERLVERVRSWRAQQEEKIIGAAVSARLRSAEKLGRTCVGLVALMVCLGAASRLPGVLGQRLDTLFQAGGALAVAALVFAPLTVGLSATAVVWSARRLNPDVSWRPHVLPLSLWTVAFLGLILFV